MPSFSVFLAQVSNATNAAGTAPDAADQTPERPFVWTLLMYGILALLAYFAFFRPQIQAKKKQEETLKSAKTGDKIITTSGIHGVITNVKETTVIVKVADNVKLEIEKSHIDKITRPDTASDSDKAASAKA